jgi:hypothetical protein
VDLSTNEERFRGFYGCNPIVYAVLLHDLQTREIDEARIELDEEGVKPFFVAIHWLYLYPTECQMAGRSGYCEKTCRNFAKKIKALVEQKEQLCQQHSVDC